MSSSELNLIQEGCFLMILLYCIVSYIVYQYRLYIYILLYTIALMLINYVFKNQNLIEVVSFFACIIYIQSLSYYIRYHTTLTLNYRFAHLAQVIASFGMLFYLVSYNSLFTSSFGVTIRLLIIGMLSIFFIDLTQKTKKIYSLKMGLLLCILGLFFYSIRRFYNSYTLLEKERSDTIFRFISILQVFFLVNALINALYSFNTEKEKLERLFFQQMQENFLFHLKVKQVNEDINSYLHDEVGSKLSFIYSLNQLALSWLEQDPNKALKFVKDLDVTIDTIPLKVEDIIFANEDPDKSKVILFKEIAAILFDPIGLSYTVNIINESLWVNVNDKIKKHLFLIYQEVLINVVKHSKSSLVSIEIDIQSKSISLSVKDYGVGFNTAEKFDGYGLYSIKRRAVKIGGNINILSSKGCGCITNVFVPL